MAADENLWLIPPTRRAEAADALMQGGAKSLLAQIICDMATSHLARALRCDILRARREGRRKRNFFMELRAIAFTALPLHWDGAR
jgi:transposase InsO family protein